MFSETACLLDLAHGPAVYETLVGQPRTRHTIESAHPQRLDPQALSDRVETEQEESSLRRRKYELTSR